MDNQKKGIIFAVITAVMWGFLAIGLKAAVEKVDAATIVWFRFSVAFACLLAYQLYKSPAGLKLFARPPMILILAAVSLAANYMGFMLGVKYSGANTAQVIIQLGPVALTLAGVTFFKEKVTRNQIAGFTIAALGMLIFYERQLTQMAGMEKEYSLGVIFAILGALTWAVYAVLQKILVMRFSAVFLNLFIFGIASILYLPFVRFDSLKHLHWGYWVLLISLGLNTLIAYGALNLALRYTATTKVSIILILNPIITFIFMGLFTYLEVSWIAGESFTLLSLAGALTVLAGAYLVVRKK